MSKPTYAELLKDPRWQKKRLLVLERDSWECVHCGDADKTLHVHHRIYRKNTKPWDYEDNVYETLCEACHKKATELQREFNEQLAHLDYTDMVTLLGYAKGLNTYSNGNVDIEVRSYEEAIGVGAAAFSTADVILRHLDGNTLEWETWGVLRQLGHAEEREYNRRFAEMLAAKAAETDKK